MLLTAIYVRLTTPSATLQEMTASLPAAPSLTAQDQTLPASTPSVPETPAGKQDALEVTT